MRVVSFLMRLTTLIGHKKSLNSLSVRMMVTGENDCMLLPSQSLDLEPIEQLVVFGPQC